MLSTDKTVMESKKELRADYDIISWIEVQRGTEFIFLFFSSCQQHIENGKYIN